jgi:uncharacterized protein (DUF433 family)
LRYNNSRIKFEIIMIAQKCEINAGIFTTTDITLLLAVPRSKVSRYLRNYWDKRFGATQQDDTYSWQISGTKNRAVNFQVLIELYICFRLQDLGVSPKRILLAHERIATETKAQYPFAERQILTDGSKILYEFRDMILETDGSRQTNLQAIIKAFADKIDFSDEGIATVFYPAGREKGIVVSPRHQFGQPIVEGTNTCIEVLYAMYQSGESVQSLSILYDIPIQKINNIVDFYKNVA